MTLILSGTDGLSDVDGSAATPAIRGTDANTGIFFPAADTVGVSTGGSERVRVDSSGNVGIGTSSPAKKLHVNGDIRLGDGGGTGAIFTDATNGLRFMLPAAGTSNTESMRIDSSGNVGIGTASPSCPLNVVSAASSLAIAINGRSSDNLGAMYFYANNGSTQYSTVTASATEFRLSSVPASAVQTFYTNASERMRIDSSGNVGIGTSSPTVKLDVRGNVLKIYDSGSATANLTVRNSTTGDAAGFTLQQDGVNTLFYNNSNGASVFATNGTERARIDSSGNLLVGATASIGDERLYVRATASTGFAFRFYNTQATAGSTFGQYILYSGSSPNGTGNQFLRCDDSTTTRAEIRSNGGLANYSANNVNLASDLRLKHDIEPVQSYWNVFKSIEWKTWLYNDQTDEIKNIGVIAQELQALAPELVCESNALPTPEGESPYLGLWENDFKMAGMSVITELVKRCEEQQAIINSLTDRITALEAK